MKKKLLSLSLLMLLSASSNLFATLKEGTNAYIAVDGLVKQATEQINQAAVELLNDSSSGAASTQSNRAIEAIIKLDDSKLNQISEAVKIGFAKSYNVFSRLLSLINENGSSALQRFLDKTTNLKNIILEYAKNNPKTTGALAVAGTGASIYGIYNYLKNKNMVVAPDEHTLKRDNLRSNELLSGGEAAVVEILPNDEFSMGGGEAAQAKHREIDPLLKAQIDEEIEAQNGDVDLVFNGRTLLGKYSEGKNARLDAVKYLVEVHKANHLQAADGERDLLIFPAAWGNADILAYLLSLGGFSEQTKANAKNYAFAGLEAKNFDQETFDKIVNLLK